MMNIHLYHNTMYCQVSVVFYHFNQIYHAHKLFKSISSALITQCPVYLSNQPHLGSSHSSYSLPIAKTFLKQHTNTIQNILCNFFFFFLSFVQDAIDFQLLLMIHSIHVLVIQSLHLHLIPLFLSITTTGHY